MSELSREEIIERLHGNIDRIAEMVIDAEQRAQRAEAECERLRGRVQTLAADFEMVASREPDDHARNVRKNAAVQLRSMLSALATPPPEGEPEDECPVCDETGPKQGVVINGADTHCPSCGKRWFNPFAAQSDNDAPNTLEQAHGDALAALEALTDVAWNNVESHENRYVIHHSYDLVRRHLTASGVPEGDYHEEFEEGMRAGHGVPEDNND